MVAGSGCDEVAVDEVLLLLFWLVVSNEVADVDDVDAEEVVELVLVVLVVVLVE